jgi:multiple sugar transport system permease protein
MTDVTSGVATRTRSATRSVEPGTSSALPYVLFAILAGTAVITLIPVVWMILTALKTPAEVAADPPTWIPETLRFANFSDAWNFAPFGRYLFNSLVMAGGIAVLQVVTSALAAYAFARLRFRGRDLLFYIYLGTLIIPPQVTVIPQFLIVRELGWVDTYAGLIIPQAFPAFGVFLLRQFFMGIPFELEEAARIDGANRFQSFMRIILPLSGPALASLAIFAFMFHWNNLLWPLIVSNTDKTIPIAVGLTRFQGERGTDWELLMAASVIATVPVLLAYFAAQRWFVQGIAMSGFGGR